MLVTDSESTMWDDIKSAKKEPKGDKPVIVPLVRSIHGIVQNVKMVVIPPVKLLERKNEFMLELKKVFFNAATEMLSFTEDFRKFTFREGSLVSGWVSASKLSLKFWKPNPVLTEERVELTAHRLLWFG